MDYNSNKSKGYVPLSSGPNMTGYYMGESPNLLSMQTGGSFGRPRTSGAALLARALQGQKDRSLLDDYEREEAKRQAKGSLFGSVLGTVGGLAGAAIGGPAGAAVGAGLGKGLGESLGAGKSKDYDKSSTVYSQQRFRDVDEASDEYNKGILGRSLVEGAKAGLTAGLAPGGGQYGQYNPLTSTGQQGIKAAVQGLGVTGYTPTQSLTSFGRAQYEGGTGGLPGTGNLTFFDNVRRSLFGGRSLYNLEDGGLIGYVDGGLTAEDILRNQGLNPNQQQLKLFKSFDPTGIQQSTQNIGQEISTQTGGQGLASLGGGFGAKADSVSTMAKLGQQTLENKIKQEQKDYESSVLGTAADIVAGGGEFHTYLHTDAPQNPDVGDTYTRGGQEYQWNGSRWIQAQVQDQEYEDYGNPGDIRGDYYTSDINLKENIDLVDLSDSGINIYTFEYKDKKYGEGVYRGVMAQEVPWASFETDNGYLAVDYSKVDVDFEQVV